MPGPDPMEEENFPQNNPTRKSADKHMREPSNVRGSRDPVPRKPQPIHEAGGEEAGEGETGAGETGAGEPEGAGGATGREA